jgi:hypothetical protein
VHLPRRAARLNAQELRNPLARIGNSTQAPINTGPPQHKVSLIGNRHGKPLGGSAKSIGAYLCNAACNLTGGKKPQIGEDSALRPLRANLPLV